jgi:predicted  nucleic acid-binding Zn-ribbon protein
VGRFSQLGKVDEIILFVSDCVRQGLSEASRIASATSAVTSKEREALEKAQAELELARGKLLERENSERNFKARLKESHSELKELYDKVNVKEKEYSQRTTELYQLRVQMKELEKGAESLKGRLQSVEKERNELKSLLDAAGKDHSGVLLALRQEK